MASEFALTDEQVLKVARLALRMVKQDEEGFAQPTAFSQPQAAITGTYSSSMAVAAAPYEHMLAGPAAEPVARSPASPLRVGAYAASSFAAWAAPLDQLNV